MKSNRISKVARPYGIGEVVRPRAVTYSVTCQEWLVHGLSVSRILPTIWVHMRGVSAVSFHSAKGRAGHWLDAPFTFCFYPRLMKSVNERLTLSNMSRASSCVR